MAHETPFSSWVRRLDPAWACLGILVLAAPMTPGCVMGDPVFPPLDPEEVCDHTLNNPASGSLTEVELRVTGLRLDGEDVEIRLVSGGDRREPLELLMPVDAELTATVISRNEGCVARSTLLARSSRFEPLVGPFDEVPERAHVENPRDLNQSNDPTFEVVNGNQPARDVLETTREIDVAELAVGGLLFLTMQGSGDTFESSEVGMDHTGRVILESGFVEAEIETGPGGLVARLVADGTLEEAEGRRLFEQLKEAIDLVSRGLPSAGAGKLSEFEASLQNLIDQGKIEAADGQAILSASEEIRAYIGSHVPSA